MKQSVKFIIVVLAVGVVLFFAGRFTAPKPGKSFTHEYDSIRRVRVQLERDLRSARDSVRHFVILSQTWFDLAQKAEKEKQKFKTLYVKEINRIHNFTDVQLDSAIRAVYLH